MDIFTRFYLLLFTVCIPILSIATAKYFDQWTTVQDKMFVIMLNNSN